MASRLREDRGSGTLLAVAAMALLGIIAAVVMVAGGYLVAYRAARTVADDAALSAAMSLGSAQGDQGSATACRAAERVARAQGLQLGRCRLTGVVPSYVITVEVVRTVRPLVPGIPDRVRATAYAGSADLG